MTRLRQWLRQFQDERGTTLIETSIASGILLVTLAGLMSMGSVATMFTENQGHLTPRTSEYAQDKMEQLFALAYSDGQSDTVVFPAAAAGGTGLSIGGTSNTSAPVAGYVDWLGSDGSYLGGGTTQPANWFYERVWQVSCAVATCTNNPAAGVKRISVTVTVRTSVAQFMLARSTVTSLKSAGF